MFNLIRPHLYEYLEWKSQDQRKTIIYWKHGGIPFPDCDVFILRTPPNPNSPLSNDSCRTVVNFWLKHRKDQSTLIITDFFMDIRDDVWDNMSEFEKTKSLMKNVFKFEAIKLWMDEHKDGHLDGPNLNKVILFGQEVIGAFIQFMSLSKVTFDHNALVMKHQYVIKDHPQVTLIRHPSQSANSAGISIGLAMEVAYTPNPSYSIPPVKDLRRKDDRWALENLRIISLEVDKLVDDLDLLFID